MTTTDTRPTEVTLESVTRLFNPRSIALVGATDKSHWSSSIYQNLHDHGFTGPVYLVNQRGAVVHGEQSYARIADLPEEVDLAFLMVPTGAVLDVLGQVADRGIPTAVLLASGFGETGEEGAALERQVVELARDRGVTILGPNGNGYVNVASSTMPYGLPVPEDLPSGPIGVVLQSGALASSVLQLAQSRAAGLSLLVSMGNESMLSMTDVMRYLVEDDATKVIALFIESVRQPEDFIQVAQAALRAGKPIVALKVGRSQMGAQVAKSHTGSLVGDDRVVEAVFRQNGVIRVDSIEDLIVTAQLLASVGALPGRRIGFVTPSGGACEIIADRAEAEGILIPEFTPETEQRLTEVLPDFASVRNPVDVTGYILIDSQLAVKALEIVQHDPNIDALVYLSELPRDTPADVNASIQSHTDLAQSIRNAAKPTIVVGNVLTDVTPIGRRIAEAAGFPAVVGGIEHGMTALSRAMWWSELHREVRETVATNAPAAGTVQIPDVSPGEVFAERRASELLRDNGIPVVPSELVHNAADAVAAAERLGYPVVVKLSSDAVAHKSDIGGVRLNLADAASVQAAFEDVVRAGREAGASDAAALVQPQRAGGIELLVGAIRDPQWGVALAVGLGGVWVEVLKDTALHVLPVDHRRIVEGLEQLRGAALLTGARNTEATDLGAISEVILKIADLVAGLGDRLESLEINPLLVRGSRVEALDALITWRA